jgi:hypothetical protein
MNDGEQIAGMTSEDWDELIEEIRAGNCTPFLGAGASAPLPSGSQLADALAKEFGLLGNTEGNLPRTAQYISLLPKGGFDRMRRFVRAECSRGRPDFKIKSQLHRALAELPLPIYITTNYDDFMTQALIEAKRPPVVQLCQWYSEGFTSDSAEPDAESEEEASAGNKPLVFHLHGAFTELKSMVLTDDDYLDFLATTSVKKWLVPTNVEGAFADTTLLFLGYSLEDITFKVLLRRISRSVRRIERSHLTVQLLRDKEPLTEERLQRRKIREAYVRRLLGDRARVYWGSCEEFAQKLSEHMNGG